MFRPAPWRFSHSVSVACSRPLRPGDDWFGNVESLYNQAIVYRRMRRFPLARTSLEDAHLIAKRIRYGTLLAHIRVERAKHFIEEKALAAD